MADQSQPQPTSTSAKAQILNDRTYQEVEYLKKNLGPILVAALAEICIRRPADPIEYLGHWLLRWRYNEELKRRDVQNALEVVRQKAWTKDDESLQPHPAAPDQPPAPATFTQGFVPGAAYAPPGYGGPLDQNVVEEATRPEGEEASAEGAQRLSTDGAQEPRRSGDAVPSGSGEQQQMEQADGEGFDAEAKTSPVTQEKRLSQLEGQQGSGPIEEKQGSGPIPAEGQQRGSVGSQGKRNSDLEKKGSGEQPQDEVRRSSKNSQEGEKRLSGQDANNADAPAEEAPPAE